MCGCVCTSGRIDVSDVGTWKLECLGEVRWHVVAEGLDECDVPAFTIRHSYSAPASTEDCGCFCKLGVLSVGVLTKRGLLFGVYIRAP